MLVAHDKACHLHISDLLVSISVCLEFVLINGDLLKLFFVNYGNLGQVLCNYGHIKIYLINGSHLGLVCQTRCHFNIHLIDVDILREGCVVAIVIFILIVLQCTECTTY